MNHSDEAVEKVLAGLRNVEPSPGMERRIQEALQDRASAPAPAWAGWKPVRWLLAGSLTLAMVIAVVMRVPLFRHQPVRPLAAGRANVVETQAGAKALAAPASTGASAAGNGRRSVRAKALVPDRRSIAVQEMRAASYPAPPMPLTEQEKLLLRVVHKGDPVELAMLNPETRARQDAEGRTEFQRFFGQAGQTTTGDNK